MRAAQRLPGPRPPRWGEPRAPYHSPRVGLTSAWPPGVSVLPQRSHLRQNLCQSLPRELTFSAAGRRGCQGPRCPWGSGTLTAPGLQPEAGIWYGVPAQFHTCLNSVPHTSLPGRPQKSRQSPSAEGVPRPREGKPVPTPTPRGTLKGQDACLSTLGPESPTPLPPAAAPAPKVWDQLLRVGSSALPIPPRPTPPSNGRKWRGPPQGHTTGRKARAQQEFREGT